MSICVEVRRKVMPKNILPSNRDIVNFLDCVLPKLLWETGFKIFLSSALSVKPEEKGQLEEVCVPF